MDKKNYIDNLKSTDLRPAKITIKERNETILLEDNINKEKTSEFLQELFIKAGEIEQMNAGMARDLAILRLSIIAELDAVSLYMRFVDLVSDENVAKVMLDVAKEEKTHAGEFETLMEHLDPNYEKQEEEGEEEIKDITGIEV